MPELPEIETTRRGITPHVLQQSVQHVVVRNPRLRWPVPPHLRRHLPGQTVERIARRGKYLLLISESGSLIVHLGMSGSLRVLPAAEAPTKHDHVDVVFKNALCLRLRDPRRFGAVLWARGDPESHPLLKNLGPEPLASEFDGTWLYQISRKRRSPVKSLIMNSHVVAGIGNIYANEALFRAGIHPLRAAGRVSLARYQDLARAIKNTLTEAIHCGGTTLRDFTNSEGHPGYFTQRLQVYGKRGDPCERCGVELRQSVVAQRSSFYCAQCQR